MSKEVADINDDSHSTRFSPIVVGFALFVIYPLSVGPVVWFATEVLELSASDFVGQMIEAFYFPLTWLNENSTLARSVFEWYLGLFGVH